MWLGSQLILVFSSLSCWTNLSSTEVLTRGTKRWKIQLCWCLYITAGTWARAGITSGSPMWKSYSWNHQCVYLIDNKRRFCAVLYIYISKYRIVFACNCSTCSWWDLCATHLHIQKKKSSRVFTKSCNQDYKTHGWVPTAAITICHYLVQVRSNQSRVKKMTKDRKGKTHIKNRRGMKMMDRYCGKWNLKVTGVSLPSALIDPVHP